MLNDEDVSKFCFTNYKNDIQNHNESINNKIDPLFNQAKEIIIANQKGSASLLQSEMNIEYARALKLIDELEKNGVIGPENGPKPREVFIKTLK